MRKLPSPFFAALLWTSLAFKADEWQPFVLDEHVSMQLPGQPKEVDTSALNQPGNDQLTSGFQLASHNEAYSIVRTTNIPVPVPAPPAALRDSFYVQRVREALRSGHGVLLYRKMFSTPAGTGVEFKTRSLSNVTKKPVTRYRRALLVNSTLYVFMLTSLDKMDSTSTGNNERSRRFFDSITAKP